MDVNEKRQQPLIILGSSRSDGNTMQAIQSVVGHKEVPIINLSSLNIDYYDYQYSNQHDDFLPLAEKMMNYSPLILATPVYWYTMSAQMKTFIDRWSDLIDFRKDLGRRLAGKDLLVIASYATQIPETFEAAFAQTCAYLSMNYKGCFYFYSGEDSERKNQNEQLAKNFSTFI